MGWLSCPGSQGAGRTCTFRSIVALFILFVISAFCSLPLLTVDHCFSVGEL